MKQPDDNKGTIKDLVLHRIETAKSDIKSAQILIKNMSRQRFFREI